MERLPFYENAANKTYKSFSGAPSFINRNKELVIILFMTFMIRFFLADWNSYWLDELYSVYRLMILHDPDPIKIENAFELFIRYQERGTAYPLYDFILYNWMELFGDTEVKTRALSNIYVTLASLFTYLFVLKVFGRRTAIATTLFFAFSYMAVYYSLEARYYGQMLFLSALSSYLLFVYLENLKPEFKWKNIFRNKYFILLTLTNVALMLTFPFNYLFLMSQSIFVLLYFLYLNRSEKAIYNFSKVATLYLTQLAVMFILWGPIMISGLLATFKRVAGRSQIVENEVNGFVLALFKDPLTIFIEYVIEPNFGIPVIAMIAMLLVFIVIVVKYYLRYSRCNLKSKVSTRKLFFFYIVFWAFIPCVLVFIIFSVGRLEQLSPRYLIYCTPPLMILMILVLEQGLILLNRMLQRLMGSLFLRHYLRHALIYAIIATTILIIPGGYQAATYRKADWRGVASQIVQLIDQNPEYKYIVYETTFRNFPMLDYYFEKYTDQVRVSGIISRGEEMLLAEDKTHIPNFYSIQSKRKIEKNDYLILAFTHHRPTHFPQTIKILAEEYELQKTYYGSDSLGDGAGGGFIVFKVQPDPVLAEFTEYVNERIEEGLSFNGVLNCLDFGPDNESYVEIQHDQSLSIVGDITIEFWLYLRDWPVSWTDIVSKYSGDYNNEFTFRIQGADAGQWYYGDGNNSVVLNWIPREDINLNEWTHIAAVRNVGEHGRLYINGLLFREQDWSDKSQPAHTELPVRVMGSPITNRFLDGRMSELRIWDVARTQEQIQEYLFKRIEGEEANLAGYWPMNEGSGFTVYDRSGNENHGINHGAAWFGD